MLDNNLIKDLTNEALQTLGKETLFLVDVKVSKANVVEIILDGDQGVKVEDCIDVSRFVEHRLDRDKEDFELTVMSFGLEEYFNMPRQFHKNIGQDIELINTDGEKLNGVLSEVNDEFVTLTTKKDKEGKQIAFDNIDKARVVINFSKKK